MFLLSFHQSQKAFATAGQDLLILMDCCWMRDYRGVMLNIFCFMVLGDGSLLIVLRHSF